MTPHLEPFDLDLDEVAILLDKKTSSLYKQLSRGKDREDPDLPPIYNVGTTGTGKRYKAREREIRAWLDGRKGGAR